MSKGRRNRTSKKSRASQRGSSDLSTYLLLTAAGCVMCSVVAPHLFKSSETASKTFDEQVKILQRGSSPGGMGGMGGMGGIGGGGFDMGSISGMIQGMGNGGGGGGAPLTTNNGGQLTNGGSQLANGGGPIVTSGGSATGGTGGTGGNKGGGTTGNGNGNGNGGPQINVAVGPNGVTGNVVVR